MTSQTDLVGLLMPMSLRDEDGAAADVRAHQQTWADRLTTT